jgi:hypothetical protein
VGLALENFDGLAIERLTENGAIIDPSGDLDGEAFANAVELGEVLSQEESFTMCIADTLYAMAAGHRPDAGEALAVDWLHARFEEDGYSLASMMRQIATSELFITAGEVTP